MSFNFHPKPDAIIRRKLAADPYLLAHAENFWADLEVVWRETRGRSDASMVREAFLRERVPSFEKVHGIRPPHRQDVLRVREKTPSDLTRVTPSATQENVRTQIDEAPLSETDRRRLRDLLEGRGPVRLTPNAVSLLCLSLWEARHEADAHRSAVQDPGRRLLRQVRRRETDPQTRALLADQYPPTKPKLEVLRGVVRLCLTAERLARVLQYLDFPRVPRNLARAVKQIHNLRATP